LSVGPTIRAGVLLGLAWGVLWAARFIPGVQPRSLSPQSAQRLWLACQEAQRAGHYDKILPLLEPLRVSSPDNPIYLSMAAQTYQQLGRAREEAQTWERYIRVAPFPADACPALGQSYERLGQDDQALDAHERCLAMDPSNTDLMLYLAIAFEHRGKFAQAESLYTQIVERAPDYADAQLGLARIELRTSRLDTAQWRVEKVLHKSPENVDALLAMALIDEKLGRRERAIQRLQKAHALNPAYEDVSHVLFRLTRKQITAP